MIKTAIIGLGDIARVHIDALAATPDVVLAAGCDIDPGTQALLPPGARFYEDYNEMLRLEKPEAVHICLPHHLHYPVARDVAAAGIHILAEKPLALNSREADEYLKLEKAYGVRIGVCLQNRYNDTSEALVRELRSGEWGTVTGVRGVMHWRRTKAYYDAKPWRASMALAGGGCMINQAIHTLDLMQYFAGSPVHSITGSVSQLLDYGIEVEDTASARMEFASGATGFFSATVAAHADMNVQLDVECERASFAIRDKALVRYDGGEEALLARDGTEFFGKACYGNSHEKLIARFYRVLAGGSEALIGPREAAITMHIIDAIRAGSEKGKIIVMEHKEEYQ